MQGKATQILAATLYTPVFEVFLRCELSGLSPDAGVRSVHECAAVNSAVQGSGADKLKAAIVLLHACLGDGASLSRGACRLVHSVSSAHRSCCFFGCRAAWSAGDPGLRGCCQGSNMCRIVELAAGRKHTSGSMWGLVRLTALFKPASCCCRSTTSWCSRCGTTLNGSAQLQWAHNTQEEALPLSLPDWDAEVIPSRVLLVPVKLSAGPSWGELNRYRMPP
jgi:hypothetical protein